MHRQTFKTTLSEGGGEGKHFCDYDCVSIPGKEEISTRFWFVSTSFVRGCSIVLKLCEKNSPVNLRFEIFVAAFRARKFFGTFKKRAAGPKVGLEPPFKV